MLVLTRKNRQEIHIGNNITIKILQIKGNSIRVGIEAPRSIKVNRGELQRFPLETDLSQRSSEKKKSKIKTGCRIKGEQFPEISKPESNNKMARIQEFKNKSQSSHINH